MTINGCHGDFLIDFQHFFASTRRAVCPTCMFYYETAQVAANINVKGTFFNDVNYQVFHFCFFDCSVLELLELCINPD